MSSFPEISLFDKGPPYRCLLDVEATGASAIENFQGANGYTAENVSFNTEQQAFEFGESPSTIWFEQIIPIQRTDNFYIRARVKLNSTTGLNVPIISCLDGSPTYRGWNLNVSDKVYFYMVSNYPANYLLKLTDFLNIDLCGDQ